MNAGFEMAAQFAGGDVEMKSFDHTGTSDSRVMSLHWAMALRKRDGFMQEVSASGLRLFSRRPDQMLLKRHSSGAVRRAIFSVSPGAHATGTLHLVGME
jgi:hypothetical protein